MTERPKADAPTEPSDPEREDAVNAIGAGAQSSDPFVAVVVSGMPAGGSDALDSKNAGEDDEDAAAHPS